MVKELKLKIQIVERISLDQQHLIFGRKELEDGRTLLEYKVVDQSLVSLVLKPRGRGGDPNADNYDADVSSLSNCVDSSDSDESGSDDDSDSPSESSLGVAAKTANITTPQTGELLDLAISDLAIIRTFDDNGPDQYLPMGSAKDQSHDQDQGFETNIVIKQVSSYYLSQSNTVFFVVMVVNVLLFLVYRTIYIWKPMTSNGYLNNGIVYSALKYPYSNITKLESKSGLAMSPGDFNLWGFDDIVVNGTAKKEYCTNHTCAIDSIRARAIGSSEDAAQAQANAITLSNKVNRICEESSAKILFPTLHLTLVHPAAGSEFGNEVVTIRLPFPIDSHVAELRTAALRSGLRFAADSRGLGPALAAHCRFGPAVNPYASYASFQFPIRTAAQLQHQRRNNSNSNSLSCLSARASPLLPYNTEAFRDVELWLEWSVVGFNSSSAANESLLLSSERYGIFTFQHAAADSSGSIDLDSEGKGASSIFSSTPVPNHQFTLAAAGRHEMVASIEYVGVNATRGELLDLTALLDYCVLDNGSALVTFNDFAAGNGSSSVNVNLNGSSEQSLRDAIATELFLSLGAVTGHIEV